MRQTRSNPQPPSYYVDLATHAECRGDYAEAAKHWFSAAARSIGHNRRQRYYEQEERCKKMLDK
jgi:hypothetical protein